MLVSDTRNLVSRVNIQINSKRKMSLMMDCLLSSWSTLPMQRREMEIFKVTCTQSRNEKPLPATHAVLQKIVKKAGKREHHLWQKRDSAGSGQKALNLLRVISGLPNEKEAIYGALDKWVAWETEFPLIAVAKALKILRKRSQWLRLIQVAKWMLSKGQGTTMGTYDALLLAFDMDHRVAEAESLWNIILHTHTRSISKRVFSRMIALYDHHSMPEKIIEVFADMEELGVRPDEHTVRRIARAFKNVGQDEKQLLVLQRYQCKWKYMHFNGERVKVKRDMFNKQLQVPCGQHSARGISGVEHVEL